VFDSISARARRAAIEAPAQFQARRSTWQLDVEQVGADGAAGEIRVEFALHHVEALAVSDLEGRFG